MIFLGFGPRVQLVIQISLKPLNAKLKTIL